MTADIPTTATLAGVKHVFTTCDDCGGLGSVRRPLREMHFSHGEKSILLGCRTCAGHGMLRKMISENQTP